VGGKQLIMVLGMGRSGTSAIAKVLELCGGHLPEVLMHPNAANPTGYWEPEVAVAINDAFLFSNGSSWYDPTLRLQSGDADPSPESAETFVALVAEFLRGCGGRGPLIVKEPRITGLLPFWRDAARREGYAIAYVIALRDPVEVSESLAARERIEPDLSDMLWLKYTLLAERESRAGLRAVVSFPSLVTAWECEIERIAAALDVDLSGRACRPAVDAFLSADLYHHRTGAALERETPEPVRRTFAVMNDAARDLPLDLARLDATYARFLACDRRVRSGAGTWPPQPVATGVLAGAAEAELDRETVPSWEAVGGAIAGCLRAGSAVARE
jgi:hypothetical protein